MDFYSKEDNLDKMFNIINGNSRISLRIVDWFSTNYSKKNLTIIETPTCKRFKVYNDYKLKLKAYSKRRFDPFCRWERINMPIGNKEYSLLTTIGQLNFFKWAIENRILPYIEANYSLIEQDMNYHNSLSKANKHNDSLENLKAPRKRRQELSTSAVRTLKKEEHEVTLFNQA
jgi:hypothetical protein